VDNLHDRALEVARQTLAPNPEFPELIDVARLLLEAALWQNSPDYGDSTSQEDTDLSPECVISYG